MAQTWEPEFTRYDYKIVQKQEMYSGYCPIKKYVIQFKLFAGGWSAPITREALNRPPAVAVVLYDPNADTVVLIEQIRVAPLERDLSPWILEIVAGMIDDGERPEDCARREALEEAGCVIDILLPVCTYWVSPGISNEQTVIYCGLTKASQHGTGFGLVHDGEDIKVHLVSADHAFLWVKQGKINSASAVIGLQWLELNRSSISSNEFR